MDASITELFENFAYKLMCVPGGGDQHDEIPTLSARIEEKQKRSQAENATAISNDKNILCKLIIDNFLTSHDGL